MTRLPKQARISSDQRFASATQADVEEATMPLYASATIRAADSAWSSFCEWRKSDSTVTKEELGRLLSRFALEHRRQDGTNYKSASLMSIMRSVVRKAFLLTLQSGSCQYAAWKFDEDVEFTGARNALDKKMRDLQKLSGDSAVKATPFNESEIKRAFESLDLRVDNPLGLISRLYFVIGLSTAARIQWHVAAKWSEISSVMETTEGLKYRTIPVGVDKNHPGGRCFETDSYFLIENKVYPDRCPLRLLDLYEAKRPQKSPDRLYLGVLHGAIKDTVWYKSLPMGVNTIGKIVPNIAVSIGIKVKDPNVKYSNHSLRATLPTILYQAAFDEQLISVVTKHRSLHGVRSYKRPSVKLLASAINSVTSGVDSRKKTSSSEKVDLDDLSETTMEAMDEKSKMVGQENASSSKGSTYVFTGCNFGTCTF